MYNISTASYIPQDICIKQKSYGGDKEIRTLDPLLARQVLSQLSYTPMYPLSKPQNRL